MDIVPQLIANSLITGSLYSILALGFNLIYSTAKFIDMGYGALAAVGGYGVFFVSRTLGAPLPFGILAGALSAGIVSVVAYSFVYRPLRRRRAGSAALLMASLGVLTALQAALAIFFTSQFQSLPPLFGDNPTFEAWGATVTGVHLVAFFSAAALFLALAFVVRRTLFGKAITAIADDEEVSQVVGINTDKIIGIVFFIAGAVAGLGGILVGFDTGIEPIMGLPLLLSAVIAAIVGGIGNLYGGFAGAFLLAFVENFGIWKIAGEWKSALAFAVLIVFLLWRPKGLFPR